MTRYVVTGPEHPQDSQHAGETISAVLAGLEDVAEFTTGGAVGVDSLAFYEALGRFPDALHRVVYPADFRHNARVVADCRVTKPIYGGPLKRNDALVRYGDVLLAFPETPERVLRSGTWSTVRRAERAGLEVRIFPISP